LIQLINYCNYLLLLIIHQKIVFRENRHFAKIVISRKSSFRRIVNYFKLPQILSNFFANWGRSTPRGRGLSYKIWCKLALFFEKIVILRKSSFRGNRLFAEIVFSRPTKIGHSQHSFSSFSSSSFSSSSSISSSSSYSSTIVFFAEIVISRKSLFREKSLFRDRYFAK
jgi:hypothetical protein